MHASSREWGNRDTVPKSSPKWRRPNEPSEHENPYSSSPSDCWSWLPNFFCSCSALLGSCCKNLHPSQKLKRGDSLQHRCQHGSSEPCTERVQATELAPGCRLSALAVQLLSETWICTSEHNAAGARAAVCTYTSERSSLWREAWEEINFPKSNPSFIARQAKLTASTI